MSKRNRIKVKAKDIAKRIVVDIHVTGLRRFRVRLFIARQLLSLAVLVGGFGGVNIRETE